MTIFPEVSTVIPQYATTVPKYALYFPTLYDKIQHPFDRIRDDVSLS